MLMVVPVNLIGLPSAAVAAGLDDQDLPLGVQIIGPRFREDLCLAATAAVEAALGTVTPIGPPETMSPSLDPLVGAPPAWRNPAPWSDRRSDGSWAAVRAQDSVTALSVRACSITTGRPPRSHEAGRSVAPP